METLTLKLIKNKNGIIEYSVLEQSAGIERANFYFSTILGTEKVMIRSYNHPEFRYDYSFVFFIRGDRKSRDHDVQRVSINPDSKQFLDLITRPNIQKIKESLAQENIDFNFVTNLYSRNITSKF
jgi:hypothetical protein